MPIKEDAAVDKNESTRSLFGSVIRDIYQNDEQAELLHLARRSSCELGFEKVKPNSLSDRYICIF